MIIKRSASKGSVLQFEHMVKRSGVFELNKVVNMSPLLSQSELKVVSVMYYVFFQYFLESGQFQMCFCLPLLKQQCAKHEDALSISQ